jgi:anti-sigma factor RsiW
MNTPISEEDLHAYSDGQLDAERLIQVETWLASHPEHRQHVDAWRAQSAQFHRYYDAVLDEPIPAHLMPPANQSHWLEARHFAAIAWLMLGSVFGFVLRGEPANERVTGLVGTSLPHMAAVAHVVYTPEVRHPVEVGADQEAHLVAWLSKRLGAQLKPPHLSEAGYQLVGGRLLPGEQGVVAQFMYENQAKIRLTLYIQPQVASKATAADASFRYINEKGIDVFYWTEDRFGYALSGKSGREDMLKLATLVYRQLNP